MAKVESICSVHWCDRPVYLRAFCKTHYHRSWRGGDMDAPFKIKGDAARFAAKVELLPNGCHHWTGKPNRDNYGKFWAEHRGWMAHAYAWVQRNGPIPAGMTVDHVCHNVAAERGECAGGVTCPHRRCVNPAHLVARTIGENTMRSATSLGRKNLAKTHCGVCGLPLSGENLRVKGNRRLCRNCGRAAWREWYQRRGKALRRSRH